MCPDCVLRDIWTNEIVETAKMYLKEQADEIKVLKSRLAKGTQEE